MMPHAPPSARATCALGGKRSVQVRDPGAVQSEPKGRQVPPRAGAPMFAGSKIGIVFFA